MNLRMGSQTFVNVQIPVLWGDRAVIEDSEGRLSVIDLSGDKARAEVIADEPGAGVSFRPRVDGFVVLDDGQELYAYNPQEKQLRSITLDLPEIQIGPTGTRVGSDRFSGNVVSGFAVGIAVTPQGIALGAPLPPKLARLDL